MEIISELLKILLPAGLVLYAVYMVVVAFLNKAFEEKKQAITQQNISTVLPIRLQAYERMALFLERITPNNLILRQSGVATHLVDFQQLLMQDIRSEFNHNLSQQIYMSAEAWERIRNAQQSVITLINQAATEVSPEAAPIELSKKIFEKMIQQNLNPTADALDFLKAEIQREFMGEKS